MCKETRTWQLNCGSPPNPRNAEESPTNTHHRASPLENSRRVGSPFGSTDVIGSQVCKHLRPRVVWICLCVLSNWCRTHYTVDNQRTPSSEWKKDPESISYSELILTFLYILLLYSSTQTEKKNYKCMSMGASVWYGQQYNVETEVDQMAWVGALCTMFQSSATWGNFHSIPWLVPSWSKTSPERANAGLHWPFHLLTHRLQSPRRKIWDWLKCLPHIHVWF